MAGEYMKINDKTKRILVIAGVTLVVYLGMKYMLPIVAPFLLAYAICEMFWPMIRFLNRKTRISKGILGGILVLLMSLGIIALLWWGGKSLIGQVKYLAENSDEMLDTAYKYLELICSRLDSVFHCKSGKVMEYIQIIFNRFGNVIKEKMMDILSYAVPAVKTAAAWLVALLIGLISAVILIKYKEKMVKEINQSYFAYELKVLVRQVFQVAGCFLKTQGIIMGLIWVICSVGSFLLHFRHVILLGFIIAFLDALPILGSGTVLVPWAVFQFAMGRYGIGIGLLVVWGLCTVTREFLEPKLMGSRFDVNPFYMIMATFIGMELFGLPGIILGPLAIVMIREILRLIYKKEVEHPEL